MKTATIKQLKQELATISPGDLIDICLRLSKFKKENKELLTYLLFEASDEDAYIRSVKSEIKQQFNEVNTNSYYYIKKSVRKILRNTKTHIRYSKKKKTEVELLLYFCSKLVNLQPSINGNVVLVNILNRQKELIKKAMLNLHEDLRYDYSLELDNIVKV